MEHDVNECIQYLVDGFQSSVNELFSSMKLNFVV